MPAALTLYARYSSYHSLKTQERGEEGRYVITESGVWYANH